MPAGHFAALEADESQIPQFFETHFPGVRNHISDTSLIHSFSENPHEPLISVRCRPYHFGSSGVIIGDAAHAMAPFYGQGMNAGMEDVRVLFDILDKHSYATEVTIRGRKGDASSEAIWSRRNALQEYSALRWKDAHAINDLSMQNYVEMRTSRSLLYRLRKGLEDFMHLQFPAIGWQTRYSRVVFSNEPYAECVRKSERQGRILCIFAAFCIFFLIVAVLYFAQARRSPMGFCGAVKTSWQFSGICRRIHD